MNWTQTSIEFGDRFRDLVADHSEWSQATFGSDDERGPMGALKHLEKESVEAQGAVGTDGLKEEIADCFLLILDASRRAGMKPMQLVEVAIDKMAVNKERKWPRPTDDTPIEHVRD